MGDVTYKPTGDKLLIKIDLASYKTGLIVDPLAKRRKTPFAVVLRAGEAVERDLIGKRVLYDIHEGWRIDERLLIIREPHLYAILTDE
jgi:hypothetical protein